MLNGVGGCGVANVLPAQLGTHVLSEVIVSHILCYLWRRLCWEWSLRLDSRVVKDGMTMQIPVVHEHQKESSNSLLFSNPSWGTFQRIADIDAHIGVPSTPSTIERIMLQPSSGPDYLRLFPPVASCEPQAKNRWRRRSRFPICTDSSR